MSTHSEIPELDANRLYKFSWAIVLYTVLIIAWGAWVRISGSGDGCGDHWPLCHGAAIPLGADQKTWIEISHRYSTAIFGLLVVGQLLMIRKLSAPNHPARQWVWLVLTFTITEALIGMFLVKQGLVNESQSPYRLLVMPLHLLNTSLLLGAEVITAESIRFGHQRRAVTHHLSNRWMYALVCGLGILLTTGAVAALGSHLMPSDSLLNGLLHDLQPGAHPAVRLRLIHPLLGLVVPLGLWLTTHYATENIPSSTHLTAMRQQLGIAGALAVLIGVLTLGLLAPVWLKLCHLTLANLLVILVARYCYHVSRS
jgi:cytochrome c oxidase assembly protein subunit 15